MSIWITWALFFVAFVYNILDAYHTTFLISIGGTEMNPLMDYVIKEFGINHLYSVKILMFLSLAIILALHQKEFKKKERKNE